MPEHNHHESLVSLEWHESWEWFYSRRTQVQDNPEALTLLFYLLIRDYFVLSNPSLYMICRLRQTSFPASRQSCMIWVLGITATSNLMSLRCITIMSCRDNIIRLRCMTFFQVTRCLLLCQLLWLRLQTLRITLCHLQEDKFILLPVCMDHTHIIQMSMGWTVNFKLRKQHLFMQQFLTNHFS